MKIVAGLCLFPISAVLATAGLMSAALAAPMLGFVLGAALVPLLLLLSAYVLIAFGVSLYARGKTPSGGSSGAIPKLPIPPELYGGGAATPPAFAITTTQFAQVRAEHPEWFTTAAPGVPAASTESKP